MKTNLFISFLIGAAVSAFSQVTTDPHFFSVDGEVTITFDATLANDSRAAGLLGLTEGVYMWSGVGTTEEPFEYGPSGQSNFNQPFEPGIMSYLGDDKWSITITPDEYFNIPNGANVTTMGLLFKNADGTAQTEDFTLEVTEEGEFKLAIIQPSLPAIFDSGEEVTIEIVASANSDISISINETIVASDTDTKNLTHTFTTGVSGDYDVVVNGNNETGSDQLSFTYLVRLETIEQTRPVGIIKGINYNQSDPTVATLCLQAPNKSSVYVIGDFNNWELSTNYQMKADEELFWLEITGLTPGEEYAFQYLVDESIYIADPFTDKILHDFDKYIPESIYPSLKAYPNGAINPIGFYNTVSILQTDQADYKWGVSDFDKPAKEKLIIYELLVRDFFDNGQESYTNLLDTLSYIKSLGVNAIELMPVTEFSGNDSWGYNPTFMFAPDKAYGSKNDLKAFIDKAHEMGIAVILDMVLNQQEQPSPLILMDFDLSTSQVTVENPYFNVSATHPFNVFYDMNHENQYTQSFVDTVNHYWIHEYKFDGFRFDLSKGFTQTNYGEDVGAWSGYDAGRIAILKRMADEIWVHSPDAYVILEHFADNAEETELANHGMMLWGNLHGTYTQNIQGNAQNIDWIYHETRGWNDPHLVGYMESHDEERQMIAASSGRTLTEGLERMKLAHTFMMMVPGPKMFWQFGELGYDVSINQNGRTGQKPNPWDVSENLPYYQSPERTRLRKVVSLLNELKRDYDLFTDGSFSFVNPSENVKQLKFTNTDNIENPDSADDMSAIIVGNFSNDVEIANISFSTDGTWYRYFENHSIEIDGNSITEELQPSELRIYTNYPLDATERELLEFLTPIEPTDLQGSEESSGVVLTWTTNSVISNGSKIYRKKGTSSWELIGTTGQFTTTFTDKQVEKDNTYQYRISSFTETAESFSNEIEIEVEDFEPLSVYAIRRLIYPNPSSSFIQFDSSSELVYFTIYSLNGQLVDQGKFKEDNKIDIYDLNRGTYLVEVITRSGDRLVDKIIKN